MTAQDRPIRIVSTPTLDIAVEESGPETGPPVFLLHGWPDDARTWDRMRPALHAAGLRTIAPYLRGFGPTRFRDPAAMRSGQLSALGRDVLELADALGLERFAVLGHDWGARAAYVAACLAPERVTRCAAMSVGWGTNTANQTLSIEQEHRYWYHWVMALPRGEAMVRNERHPFTRYIWRIWNAGWTVPDAEVEATPLSVDKTDLADVTLHTNPTRRGHAAPDPSCAALDARLQNDPVIRVPTLMLHGGSDPVTGPETSEGKEHLFAGPYQRVVLEGLGHFPQRQNPDVVLAEVLPFLTSS